MRYSWLDFAVAVVILLLAAPILHRVVTVLFRALF